MTHNRFQAHVNEILKELCKMCPHQKDKHFANCIECCPLTRAKEKIVEEKQAVKLKDVLEDI